MNGAATNMVPVFSQVGQVAEISECTDHAHRLVAAQALEQLFQGAVSVLVGIAPERDRQLANLFNQVKRGLSLLLPDHVAQNPPKQPDVFDQRSFVVLALGRWRAFGGDRGGRFVHGGGKARGGPC